MDKVTVGFVPAHRVPFDEEWAIDMRRRTLEALSEAEGLEIIVPDDQLSLAIGKRGQNVRLAAQLTNWKIDIFSESKIKEQAEEIKNLFQAIEGVGEKQLLSVIEEENGQPISRRDYHGCFPVRLELLSGFELDTWLRVRLVLSFDTVTVPRGCCPEGSPDPSLCEVPPHAVDVACGNCACYITSCERGWYDANGVFDDGCEAAQP